MPSSQNPFGDLLNVGSKPSGPTFSPYMPAAAPPTLGTTGSPGDGSALPSGGSAPGYSNAAGAVGALAPLLLSLFGNNPDKGKADSNTDLLTSMAKALSTQGAGLAGQGENALHPVIAQLLALTGADPSALGLATQPERAKVLDQYDTARKALTFSPRGGGTASATMQAGARAAFDTSTIVADARSKAFTDLGNLGKNLLDTGVQETEQASNALSNAITAYQRGSQQQTSDLAGIGSAIGKAIPFLIAAL